MSEAVAIEMGKKMSKVGAIRQALSELGEAAESTEIRERAMELSGADIDIRNVYQVRSNMKTGRDSTTKTAKVSKKTSVAKVAAPKPKAKKAAKIAKPTKVENKVVSDNHDLTSFFTLWEAAKAFGTKEQAIDAINRLPAF